MTRHATGPVTTLPGIRFLDHTADVGIDVVADSREELFHRAALGMLALLAGVEESDDRGAPVAPGGSAVAQGPAAPPGSAAAPGSAPGPEPVSMVVDGTGDAEVLLAWLRELLFLHETRHQDYVDATFDRLDETGVSATVRTEPSAPAVREIKGVTYHELAAERTDNGWRARVIFDV